ncbi:outer membrane beta-barrel protein [Paraprevotella clara]|uniref:outer membrane beta-barrel protein n=1 Tax=Paraprevotella clara TaxID=454154 RepID=UPI0026769E95|nr:outer membrane beta-barrel protein [Paraprevotella clara]
MKGLLKFIGTLGLLYGVSSGMAARVQETGAREDTAQVRTIPLWGHVKDGFTYTALHGTFVTLMREDSTVVDTMHVQCFNSGTPQEDTYYKFDVPARRARYIIKAEHPDYYPEYVDCAVRYVARNPYVDARHHEMRRRPYASFADRSLGEVVVKATKIRVAYRGDTVVYNADAFNLSEGAMLNELVRQLPGAELKPNGEIYVNGRKVDYLTLNGTDFFKGDNRKMLDNLPAFTVQQVKVYDKTTDRSEFLGYDTEKKAYVMDVSLKREYNTGYMANVAAGGGTDSRYAGRAFGLRYSDRSRVTLFGGMNNTNVYNDRPGENGEWPEESLTNGEFVTRQAGGEFFWQNKAKGIENSLTANAEWGDRDVNRKSATEAYLPQGNRYTRSSSLQDVDYMGVNANNWLTWKTKDHLLTVHSYVGYDRTDTHGYARDAAFDSDPSAVGGIDEVLDSAFLLPSSGSARMRWLNRSSTRSLFEEWKYNVGHDMMWDAKLPWGDNLQLRFTGSLSRTENDRFEHYLVDYASSGSEADRRNRYDRGRRRNYYYQPSAEYTFNFPNDWHFLTYYIYKQDYRSDSSPRYRLDSLAGWEVGADRHLGELPSARELSAALDVPNSYYRHDLSRVHTLGLRTFYSRRTEDKYVWFNFHLPFTQSKEDMRYRREAIDAGLQRRVFRVQPDFTYLVYWFGGTRYFRTFMVNADMALGTPDLVNRLSVRDASDPLHVRVGNPYLQNSWRYNFRTGFLHRSPEKKWFTQVNVNAWLGVNDVAQGFSYNSETGVYTYRPQNVDGNRGVNGSLAFQKEGMAEYWNVGANLNYDFHRSVDLSSVEGMTESVLSKVHNHETKACLSTGYQRGSLTLNVGCDATYRHADGSRADFNTVDAFDFRYGLLGEYTMPWKIHLSTRLNMYSRRGYDEAAMNTDYLIWNASLSRSFLKDRLMVKVEGVDLLRQMRSVYMDVNVQGKTETYYNIVKGYYMLTLGWKLTRNPKKRE